MHIGAADGALGAVEAVELDVAGDDAAFFADAGGVDDDEGFAVLVEADVDAVAGGAGDFGDDDALGVAFVEAGDGVDEGALAGVALADDGEHHLGFGEVGRGIREVDIFFDGDEELVEVSLVEGGDTDGGAESEAGEIAEGDVGVGAVGFVGDEEGFDAAFAEHGSDFFVATGEAVLAIDDEEDEGGLGHGDFDLLLDVFSELVGVDEAVATGVDEVDEAAVDFEGEGDAVAGDAGHVFDDADAFLGEGVEEGALTDVGSADDGDDGEGGHWRGACYRMLRFVTLFEVL